MFLVKRQTREPQNPWEPYRSTQNPEKIPPRTPGNLIRSPEAPGTFKNLPRTLGNVIGPPEAPGHGDRRSPSSFIMLGCFYPCGRCSSTRFPPQAQSSVSLRLCTQSCLSVVCRCLWAPVYFGTLGLQCLPWICGSSS